MLPPSLHGTVSHVLVGLGRHDSSAPAPRARAQAVRAAMKVQMQPPELHDSCKCSKNISGMRPAPTMKVTRGRAGRTCCRASTCCRWCRRRTWACSRRAACSSSPWSKPAMCGQALPALLVLHHLVAPHIHDHVFFLLQPHTLSQIRLRQRFSLVLGQQLAFQTSDLSFV